MQTKRPLLDCYSNFSERCESFLARVKKFNSDEIGASEAVEKLLILALIAVPLLILLIAFKDKIITFAETQFARLGVK